MGNKDPAKIEALRAMMQEMNYGDMQSSYLLQAPHDEDSDQVARDHQGTDTAANKANKGKGVAGSSGSGSGSGGVAGYGRQDTIDTSLMKDAEDYVDTSLRSTNVVSDDNDNDDALLSPSTAVSNNDDSSSDIPVFKGYLYKLSPSFFASWQKRWIEITSGIQLLYKKSENDVDNRGIVNLTGSKVTWLLDKKNSKGDYIITISYSDASARCFSFKTNDALTRDIVVTLIQDTIYAQTLKRIVALAKMYDEDDDDDETEDEFVHDDDDNDKASSGGSGGSGGGSARDNRGLTRADSALTISSTTQEGRSGRSTSEPPAKSPRKSSNADDVTPHAELKDLLLFGDKNQNVKILNYLDSTGNTLLHICALNGASKVCRLLIKAYKKYCNSTDSVDNNINTFINKKNSAQQTSLMLSLIKQHNKTSLQILNDVNVNINQRGDSGNTYLHYASKSNAAVIQKLVVLFNEHAEKDFDVTTSNVKGILPHHEMAHYGNLEGLEALITANPDFINQSGTKDGYSPLHWAAREGHAKVVKMLIARGADISVKGHSGNTPLHLCIQHYVTKSKNESKAKSIKYHKSYTLTIIEFVNAGANLEDVNKDGLTALAHLCHITPEFVSNGFGGKEAFEAMLAAKATPKIKSSKGLTPLHFASMAGNWALVELLIDNGAEVNAQANDNYTAIGLVEKVLNKRTARVQYKSIFPLLETTVKILLKGGAVRRAHVDFPIEANVENKIEYMRNTVDGTYQMKFATIPALIERLSHRVFYSPTDVTAFVLQYRKFCKPLEILENLKLIFQKKNLHGGKGKKSDPMEDRNQLGVRRSVLCFLEAWLSTNDECFDEVDDEEEEDAGDSEALDFLTKFSEAIMDTFCIEDINRELEKVALPFFGDFVREVHEQHWDDRWLEQQQFFTLGETRRGSFASAATAPVNKDFGHYKTVLDMFDDTVAKKLDHNHTKANKMLGRQTTFTPKKKTKISEFSSEDLAQQLTLLTHVMFCEIPVTEFVDNKYKSFETGPNFQRMKAMSNKLSFFLISAILQEEDVTARANVIKLLIQTAENCLGLENFDMFVSIISVLGSSAIHRLKQTWIKLDKLLPGKWAAIQKASGGAGRNLEKKMNMLKPPCVPCIGLLLRMLINLDEEPGRNDHGMINFHKLRKIGGVLRMIESAKSVPYSFALDSELLPMFTGNPEFGNEDDCWNQSKAIEEKLEV
jgi:ankyrin repeat protein